MINAFLSGTVAAASLAVAAFFLRFWQKTHERLFIFFGLAFFILMLERVVRLLIAADNELAPYVFCLRLTGFLLIIAGIIDKNRRV